MSTAAIVTIAALDAAAVAAATLGRRPEKLHQHVRPPPQLGGARYPAHPVREHPAPRVSSSAPLSAVTACGRNSVTPARTRKGSPMAVVVMVRSRQTAGAKLAGENGLKPKVPPPPPPPLPPPSPRATAIDTGAIAASRDAGERGGECSSSSSLGVAKAPAPPVNVPPMAAAASPPALEAAAVAGPPLTEASAPPALLTNRPLTRGRPSASALRTV